MPNQVWMTSLLALKPRVQEIFQDLLEREAPVRTTELAQRYRLSDRSIRYDLEELEQSCVSLPVTLVHRRNGVWLDGPAEARRALQREWAVLKGATAPSPADQRLYVLLALLLTAEQPLVVKQLQDVVDASPRTVYADMDRAERWLVGHGLRLIRKPHFGAKVEGEELYWRHASYRLLLAACPSVKLLDLCISAATFWNRLCQSVDARVRTGLVQADDVQTVARLVADRAAEHPHLQGWWTKLVLYTAVTLGRMRQGHAVSLLKSNLKLLQQTAEYQFALTLAVRLQRETGLPFAEEETGALALYMLGAHPNLELQECGAQTAAVDDFSQQLVTRMLKAVDETLGIVLSTDEDLFRGLILHIKPMVYRLLYGVSIENDMLEDIKEDHALAYYAAVVAAQFLEGELGKPLNAAEIGYIALHFGAALERRRARPASSADAVRILVVCAGGIGTGKILQSRIEANLTHLQVVDVLDQQRIHHVSADAADVIVSTVELSHSPLPHIVVNPLLPLADYHRVNRWVASVMGMTADMPGAERTLLKPVLDVIQAHYEVLDPAAVTAEIHRMFTRIGAYLAKPRAGGPASRAALGDSATQDSHLGDRKKVFRMLDLLTEESIRVQAEAANPNEVVDIAGQLLVDAGAVAPRYVQAMKTSLAVNGPYMVIVPGIAILHARPEDGVERVCMSLVTLANGVAFGHKDNDPVDIAIAFGAVDNEAHLQALSDLMRLLADSASLDAIRRADDVQQVLAVIRKVTA
ncbi:BglG family transcription antiterminator [Alicyclobacillus shizuokensis]|uniref:BglG family transcription antiterminator n=1 Tax=Alicyclobacillus shizuokensis TaxID=392014 RepID=UPI00082C84A9|nr:BglG family transcription antiterminator [Alicyclobacillus shizuokensis]